MVSFVRSLLHQPAHDQPRRAITAPASERLAFSCFAGTSIDPVPPAPIQHATDAATSAPPLLGALPSEASRRISTPAALPEMSSPAEIEFVECVERYSHTDWVREQRAESVYDPAIRYLLLGSPSVLPDDLFFHLAPHDPPRCRNCALLAIKATYTYDDGILLPVRKLAPLVSVCPDMPGGRAARLFDNKPTRIYVPLLMRPWIMQACHAKTSCHLGVACTLSMPQRFYWWIGMNISTRWWLRRCLQYQERTSSRQTVPWVTLSLPLPPSPIVAESVDYFGSLPVTRQGNSYTPLFTFRFS